MLESPSRLFSAVSMASEQADADALLSDQALMEAAKHDPSAFATLYQRYFARVYRYLRIRLQSEEDAADLTQQVFLKALDALPRYQTRSTPVGAWLFTIARNARIDRFRRQQATLPLEAASDVLAEHETETIVLRRETYEQLSALLSTLNAEARDLLALRFAAGLTTPEIADILGKRPEAVRKSLSRLLHTLKEQYHATR